MTGVQEGLCKFMSCLCPVLLGFHTPIPKQEGGQASGGGFQGRQEACVAQRAWSLDSRRCHDYPLYLASSGEGALEFFLFFAVKALERAEGGAEADGEWMGGRSGSTARGRRSFFRPKHLLSSRLLARAAEVPSSVCGPHLFRGYIRGLLPSTLTWQVLITPLPGARNYARC